MAVTVDVNTLRAFANLPGVEVIPDASLQIDIDIAGLIRSEDFANSGLSSDRLDLIELNLAAHFAIVTYEYGGLTQQEVGDSAERYRMIGDEQYGLASTRFGQSALGLDTTGTLSKLASSPLKARFQVV